MGYKDPPQHTQFKKGQSGNPKGRPRKIAEKPRVPSAASALVLTEAQRQLCVREGDEVRQISTVEAVILAQKKSALSGSAYAQRDFLARYDLAERERREKIEEDCRRWTEHVNLRKTFEQTCAEAGRAMPDLYPHLDDIKIDWTKGVDIVGPLDEQEEQELQRRIELRDVWLLQSTLDWKKARPTADASDQPGFSDAMFFLFNKSIPERFRLSDREIAIRMLSHRSIPKRELLKKLYQRWKSAGHDVPRGRTFPSRKYTERFFEAVSKLMKRVDSAA
jgi:hypothetical protein